MTGFIKLHTGKLRYDLTCHYNVRLNIGGLPALSTARPTKFKKNKKYVLSNSGVCPMQLFFIFDHATFI